jgi:DNA polymerase
MQARGKPRKVSDDRIIYPILHPAAALHRQELRTTIETDFLTIPELLKSDSSKTVSTDKSPKQLDLF